MQILYVEKYLRNLMSTNCACKYIQSHYAEPFLILLIPLHCDFFFFNESCVCKNSFATTKIANFLNREGVAHAFIHT